ncbi:MAG: diacylglycerol kinase [Deltaproteobacteria bacterium]|nr:MAG: diacylglycerol kinase [Deltaproteobacteria bacterium]
MSDGAAVSGRRVGLLLNPNSRRNRQQPDRAQRLVTMIGPIGSAEVTQRARDVPDAIARLLETRPDVIAICGGDGTNHLALTALRHQLGDDALPPVAFLRGGTMNTVANGLGITGTPEHLLTRLMEAPYPLPVRPVGLLGVRDDVTTRYGFLFGTGVMARFLELYYEAPDPNPVHAARTLTRVVTSVVAGGALARSLLRTERSCALCDGSPWLHGPTRGILASSVPEIGLGFTPFPRCDEVPGRFHAIGLLAGPTDLVRALPSIWRGSHPGREGLPDRVAGQLRIRSQEGHAWVLDGDLYPCRGALDVHWDQSVSVFQPEQRSAPSTMVDRLRSR